MKLVILADRYYPDIVGGGEISLYHIVEGLKNSKDIDLKVIAQSEEILEETVDFYNKIEIRRIPIKLNVSVSNMRPRNLRRGILELFYSFTQITTISPLILLGKMLLTMKYWFIYLFKKTNSSFTLKTSLIVSNLISFICSKENVEYLDSDFNFFIDADPLFKHLRKSACDLFHADNTRSILRYVESGAKFPTVAVVRDLKFYCPRRTIIANTSNGPCNICEYQCLDDLPFIQRPFIKKVFEANISYRLGALKKHNVVVCTSPFLQELLKKSADIEAYVIPNPVKLNNRMLNTKSKSNNKRIKKLLFVGMIIHNKGVDIAVHVLDRILKDGITAKLFIAGRGSLENLIEKKARSLNIEKNLKILGFIEKAELDSHYKTADVLICPVRWPEPFGRVALEAMACGTPVVAYNLGGFSDTILDGETGFLAAPGDIEDFTSKVKIILLDDNLRKRMGKRCLQWVKEEFQVEKIVQKYVNVYHEAINDNIIQ